MLLQQQRLLVHAPNIECYTKASSTLVVDLDQFINACLCSVALWHCSDHHLHGLLLLLHQELEEQ